MPRPLKLYASLSVISMSQVTAPFYHPPLLVQNGYVQLEFETEAFSPPSELHASQTDPFRYIVPMLICGSAWLPPRSRARRSRQRISEWCGPVPPSRSVGSPLVPGRNGRTPSIGWWDSSLKSLSDELRFLLDYLPATIRFVRGKPCRVRPCWTRMTRRRAPPYNGAPLTVMVLTPKPPIAARSCVGRPMHRVAN